MNATKPKRAPSGKMYRKALDQMSYDLAIRRGISRETFVEALKEGQQLCDNQKYSGAVIVN